MAWYTGFENIGGDYADAIGLVAKGFLVIPNLDKVKDMEAQAFTTDFNTARNGALRKAKDKLKQDANKTYGMGGSVNASDMSDSFGNGKNYFTLQVQYNPNTISMRSMSGEQRISLDYMGALGQNQMGNFEAPAKTTMDVTLIFEAINQYDAFIVPSETLLNIGPGALVSAGSSIYQRVTDGNGEQAYSVRPVVEGLMSLMNNDYLRRVIFCYGGTFFSGLLINVSPTYKMFNKAGNPILAEVRLTIEQAVSDITGADSDPFLTSFKDFTGTDLTQPDDPQ